MRKWSAVSKTHNECCFGKSCGSAAAAALSKSRPGSGENLWVWSAFAILAVKGNFYEKRE